MKLTEVQAQDDQALLEGLVEENSAVITHIYESYFETIKKFVLGNSGNEEDARDLFQYGLKVIYIQARDGLVLRKSFNNYLCTICSRRWYNLLKRKGLERNYQNEPQVIEMDNDIINNMVKAERLLLFRRHFRDLADSCRQILQLGFDGFSLKEIATQLKYSYAYVRRRKSVCTSSLMEAIQADPLFLELKNGV